MVGILESRPITQANSARSSFGQQELEVFPEDQHSCFTAGQHKQNR